MQAPGIQLTLSSFTEDVLAWVPPLERPIESSETPGNQVADTSGIQVADPTLAAPDASPNPGPMSNAEPNPEYLVYLDVSSWTPSDLALYPAICAITFRYLPEVKDAPSRYSRLSMQVQAWQHSGGAVIIPLCTMSTMIPVSKSLVEEIFY